MSNTHVDDWNEMFLKTENINESLEGEDVYSVALGFLVGRGYTFDQAHELLGKYEVEL